MYQGSKCTCQSEVFNKWSFKKKRRYYHLLSNNENQKLLQWGLGLVINVWIEGALQDDRCQPQHHYQVCSPAVYKEVIYRDSWSWKTLLHLAYCFSFSMNFWELIIVCLQTEWIPLIRHCGLCWDMSKNKMVHFIPIMEMRCCITEKESTNDSSIRRRDLYLYLSPGFLDIHFVSLPNDRLMPDWKMSMMAIVLEC